MGKFWPWLFQEFGKNGLRKYQKNGFPKPPNVGKPMGLPGPRNFWGKNLLLGALGMG